MAGSQQQQIIDTIFSMKRRLLRHDDSSDSEETETPYSSQKQNLKRKVHYSRSGDPDFLSDPRPYKKRIEHAGYHRRILQRNPPRYDPDGDIVEIGDEYEDEDDLSTVEENPYADIHLEVLLAPLTSPADLPNHPSLSTAYTSKHLTNLIKEAAAISRKEQITLGHAKTLFTKLLGDSSFAPHALSSMTRMPLQDVWGNGTNVRETNGNSQRAAKAQVQNDAQLQDTVKTAQDMEIQDAERANGNPQRDERGEDATPEAQNGTQPITNGTSHASAEIPQTNGERLLSPAGDDVSETASQHTAHRMTTRARAQAASTPSPPSSPSTSANPIHPLFTFAPDSLPDRDFGLPPGEAEETRMLLMAYVQKQQEIARVATELYHGMMQGERMRQDVFKWSKAEAHIGEMSDGEDWYDREEWGLDQDLIKGRDEEEDDTAVAGKKSTRQRRKPDKDDR